MSIIIKGMDMPVSGARYRVVEDLEGNKFLTSDGYFNGMYYPISSLPEKHGKIVDGDAFRKKCIMMRLKRILRCRDGIVGVGYDTKCLKTTLKRQKSY